MLEQNILNGRNTLIHSPRRLGKSALIRHLFYYYEKEKTYETLYVDLFASQNMEDLIKTFAKAILSVYHKKNIISGIKKLLKGINSSISFSADGTPQLSLNFTEGQTENTIGNLFEYLETRNKKVIVAFDEFQEISKYPERAEAILRTHIQKLSNVQFIFSGSTNHILQNMFYDASRPFYQSTEVMVLDKIDHNLYANFINDCFTSNSKNVSKDSIKYILDFTETYTYYTQSICNQVFSKTEKELSIEQTIEITNSYIENRKIDYMGLYNLLPENHKKIVIAVAKEGVVNKPSSIEFLMKNKLPSASSTLQAINALAKKEILYKNNEGYRVYDVFFKHFLIRYF